MGCGVLALLRRELIVGVVVGGGVLGGVLRCAVSAALPWVLRVAVVALCAVRAVSFVVLCVRC